jgi:NAD-dependent deacetylase
VNGPLQRLADLLAGAATSAAVLTGAGVSAPSGIPTFREPGGVWDRYDPMEYGHISAFHRDPRKVWRMLREFDQAITGCKPNPAHAALAQLAHMGFVGTIITQNADGLHQEAGSPDVVELHGNSKVLVCLQCDRRHTRTEAWTAADDDVPRCQDCAAILKPDAVFFGEPLPPRALQRAWDAARISAVLLVIGTSAEVEPAASIPLLARQHGAAVWEINPIPALALKDEAIASPAEQVLPALVQLLRGRTS